MELQQRINQQRVRHIIDSYQLMGDDGTAFENTLNQLLSQYPHRLIELALVETLIKSWLTVPRVKGISFLGATHSKLQQWQTAKYQAAQHPTDRPALNTYTSSFAPGFAPDFASDFVLSFTPSQFAQVTGLDAEVTLGNPTADALEADAVSI